MKTLICEQNLISKVSPSIWNEVWRTESSKKEEMNDYQITEDDGGLRCGFQKKV